jgi:hypothetical protein
VRYLPRVVALLDGTPQKKGAIRSIFLSVIAPPAHFSSINSLRTRSDSLSPVELMLFLHQHDKEIGLKHTIEGEIALVECSSPCARFSDKRRVPSQQPSRSASQCPTASVPRYWRLSCSRWSMHQKFLIYSCVR